MKMTYRVPEPIATYGDVDFLKYGGQLLLPNRDEIGNPYLEVIEPPTENLDTTWVIYRFDVDRLKKVIVKRTYHLVPFGYEPATWPHPVRMYNEWFVDSLPNVAESMDCPEEELITDLCSEKPEERARAYIMLGEYHGWENFDSYPLHLSEHEAHERYGQLEHCECEECEKAREA
jgi:hypothetical protein